MNMPIAILNRRRRGGAASAPAFSPSALFALAEPGVWYDPSDLTTLFQDTAGTTPVTTPGQTVALALDKSKGLVLGSELAGGILDSTANWTFTGSVTVAGGVLAFTTPPSTTAQATYNPILTSAKRFRITFTASGTGQFTVRAGSGGDQTSSLVAPGTFSLNLLAGGGTPTQLIFASAVSGVNNYVGNISNISVKELPGFHATQATTASRPTYQVDGNGKAYLAFDGVDDFMVTPTITPGIDKAQVFAGVRKLSDAAAGILVESSVAVGSNAGSFYVSAPEDTTTNRYQSGSRGSSALTITRVASITTGAAPDTAILTATHDISGDLSTLRRNAVAGTSGTGDKGTGNFLAYPLYIGRRGGTSLPFSGNLYSLIVRFGTNLTTDTITSTETWVNGKTGAY